MAGLLDNAHVTLDPTGTRPVKVRGEFTLNMVADVNGSVRAFLAQHANELAVPFGVGGLQLVKEVQTPGRHVLRYNHTIDGIRVFGAQSIVAVDPANKIQHIELYAGPTRVLAPAQNTPLLTPAQALDAATKSVGDFKKRLETRQPQDIWFPTDAGVVRAYEVIIATTTPIHDWQIIIDAHSGKVLLKRDLVKELPDGSGMVFDPNPVVAANNNTFRDPTATVATCGFGGTAQATIDAQRVSRTLKDLTVTAGNYTLSGPYCQIHDFAAPAGPNPTEASGVFNYASNDSRFNAVMIYYHIDTFQRYLQSIGITSAHASVIQCDPLDDSIISAWFSPVDGGLHFSDSGTCRPDRATDADCMIHEYQHAIQNNLVPGWGGTNPTTHRDEAGAMGEGAGDFVACMYFADRGGGYQREVFEDWVFGFPPAGGPATGLRRVDGTKIYPTSWLSDVHSDGEIWSAALWNIYRAIGGDVTGAGAAAAHEQARQAMLRSLFHSYPLLTTTASMPDGAEAIMNTNALPEEYRGQHLREMLQSFHDRGILAVGAGADLYVKDDPSDPGTESYHSSTFWDSPDVWIRNADDGGTTHQQPITGHDNWFYARVHNRGSASARAFVVTFNAKLWLGTEFVYESDFVPFISAAPGFNLAPGGAMVVKAKWPAALVPPAHAHGCVLVSVFSPREPIPAGTHVWDHGNLAQKNTTIQPAAPGDVINMAFRFGNRLRAQAELMRLELHSPTPALKLSLAGDPAILKAITSGALAARAASAAPAKTATAAAHVTSVTVLDPARVHLQHAAMAAPAQLHLQPGSQISLAAAPAAAAKIHESFFVSDAKPVLDSAGHIHELAFEAGPTAGLPIALPARTDVELTLRVAVPKTAKSGEVYVADVVQKNAKGQVVGGVRARVVVR